MPLPRLLLGLCLLAACQPGSTKLDDDQHTGGVDDDTGERDSGSPLGDSVSELSARLHDEILSIVYVSWTQSAETGPVHVEYSFDEGEWLSTPEQEGTVGSHEQIVLGVPYGMELSWRLVAGGSSVDGPAITTGAAPRTLPGVVVSMADEARWDTSGGFVLTSVSTEDPGMSLTPSFYVVFLDRQGRYVWAVPADEGSWTLFQKVSRDGKAILYDDSLFWTEFDGGVDSRVHRIHIDGREERSWDTPGLSHAFDDLSEDTLAWFASGTGNDVLKRTVGSQPAETLWDCRDWVETTDMPPGGRNGEAVCGTNSLTWDPELGTYMVSLWTQEAVVELDAETLDALWYACPDNGTGYTLEGEEGEWVWQHEAYLVAPDRMLLSSGVGQARGGGFDYTAAYEYEIDREAGTLSLVWSYTSPEEFAARFKGAAHRLPGGNTLHAYGSAGGLQEITPAGDVVWRVQFDGDDPTWTGRGWLVDDLYGLGG